ncbi:MAG: transcription-repair coupling factor, partial [Thermodesulfobacteriota bacterium]
RIEFAGDKVRSLRYFSVDSQKSLEKIQSAEIYPASEFILGGNFESLKNKTIEIANDRGVPATLRNNFLNLVENNVYTDEIEQFVPLIYGENENLLSYLGKDYLIFLDVDKDFEAEFDSVIQATNVNNSNKQKFYKILPDAEQVYLLADDLVKRINKLQVIKINDLVASSENHVKLNSHSSKLAPSDTGTPIQNLSESVNKFLKRGYQIYLVSYNENEQNKLKELLSNYTIDNLNYSIGNIETGFIIDELKIAVFSENDFSEKDKHSNYELPKNGFSAFISSFSDLKLGDYIVHKKFGIGIYNGLMKLKVGSNESDFLECEYRDGDKIFVPVENLKLVQRYIGDNKKPRIDKLGSGSWKNTVKKVKKAVENIARELLDLYAKRKAIKGFSFSKRDQVFNEFEMDFSFEETPDQSKSIEEVMSDMERPKPMDRLICGDVGFGKTEIALRAAFKAAMDGKQVAFLVPTTLLANQHFDTFKNRLKNYPINSEMLSRFRTAGESKKIYSRLSDGNIDIIIGTHKLLGKKVKFNNLGLVIIDEEHKFGVKHKEKLRLLSDGVDVLSLSATPIPRSLQLSLANIRDISLVNTPPEGRIPVDVYINNYSSEIIREAVISELDRGGLVFFINNRIENIFELAEYLKTLIPEASIGVTHGRMKEKNLEDCISGFIDEKINLLVTTAIVESGLDIPNANTIIVNDAHKFGLADLYQLKGRVGRGKIKAYAYFLVPSVSSLSTDARKRLTKLSELQDLGSGFKLAMSDLEIRGAGNLFGEEQSGTISEVGLELYLEMLQKAVNRFNQTGDADDYEPEIKSYESAFIPESYIGDNSERLYYYKKLTSFNKLKELKEIREEISDRFGKIPVELKNLTKILELKYKLKNLRISKLEIKKDHSVFTFKTDSPFYENSKPGGKMKIYYDEIKKYSEIDRKLGQLRTEIYH